MLEAKDLRIGNWYQWAHEESISYKQVDPEFIHIQHEYDTNPDDDQFARGWWAQPIPLNKEWFLKFGFEHKSNHFTIKTGWYYSLSQEKIQSKLRIKLTRNENFHVKSPANGTIYLKYVHQLQNLYFVLAEKELEIKELTKT